MSLENTEWIWKHWLAVGKVHILAADAGVGKSTLAQALVATVTIGGRWPDGTQAEPGNALIWSGEEGVRDVVLPRLTAMGADRARVFFPEAHVDAVGQSSPFDPARDLELLEQAIAEHDICFVVLDPVLAVLASGDSNSAVDVRAGMAPVQTLAERTGAAVLGITHLNKNSMGRLLHDRILGSQAWTAVARSAWVTLREYGGDRRVLVRAKSNFGPREGGFTYWIDLRRFNDDGQEFEATTVQWGELLAGNPDTIAEAAERRTDGDARDEDIRDFIREQFADREAVPSNDIKQAARAAGHPWHAVERLARAMGVKARKGGDDSRAPWVWRVPLDGLRSGEDRLAPFHAGRAISR